MVARYEERLVDRAISQDASRTFVKPLSSYVDVDRVQVTSIKSSTLDEGGDARTC
jgi:hypothetical protein